MSAATSTTALVGVAGGGTVEAPSVIVRDQHGNGMAGVTVSFTVTGGGGTVSAPTAVTSVLGNALTGWTLGTTAGPNTLVVSSGGLPPVTFTATATSGPPVSVTVSAGDGQTATVGSAVPIAPAVTVRDGFGNLAANVAVVFAVTAGGGQVIGATQRTNSAGVAAPTAWVLGGPAGVNSVRATIAGLAPVVFSATGLAGPPFVIVKALGDNQLAVAGSAVASLPSVTVRDAYGNLRSGVVVTFSVASGGGSVTGGSATTDASGTATVGGWTTGAISGTLNTLTASVPGLIPVTFSVVTLCASSTAHTFGSVSTGTLSTSDCRTATGASYDNYSTTVSATSAYMVRLSSTSFDTYLSLLAPEGRELAANNDSASTTTNSAIKVILPAGNYLLVAASRTSSGVGPYTLSSASTTADVTGCKAAFIVRGVTTAQSLATTDCYYYDYYDYYDATYQDEYLIYIRRGETLTVTMTSTGFSPALALQNSSSIGVAYKGGSPTSREAVLTYTAISEGYHRIIATTPGAVLGSYVLKVQ